MTLHVEEYGSDSSPTIVFIHAAALGGWMWRQQIEALSDQFHCLAPDLPGHGKSGGQFTLDNSAKALADLIRDKAHNSKASIVGLSLGGLVAIHLLDKFPDLIVNAIVSAPPSGPIPGTGFLVFATRFLLPIFKSDFVIRRTADQLKLPEKDYEKFRDAQKSMTADTLRQIARITHEHRLPESLKNSTIPTLAVVGEKEIGVNFRVVRDLVKLMPTTEGRVAPNVGHGWNGENPTLFNQMIQDWFINGTIPSALMPLDGV